MSGLWYDRLFSMTAQRMLNAIASKTGDRFGWVPQHRLRMSSGKLVSPPLAQTQFARFLPELLRMVALTERVYAISGM